MHQSDAWDWKFKPLSGEVCQHATSALVKWISAQLSQIPQKKTQKKNQPNKQTNPKKQNKTNKKQKKTRWSKKNLFSPKIYGHNRAWKC